MNVPALDCNGMYGPSYVLVQTYPDIIAEEFMECIASGCDYNGAVKQMMHVLEMAYDTATAYDTIDIETGEPDAVLQIARMGWENHVLGGRLRDNATILVDRNMARFKAAAREGSQPKGSPSKRPVEKAASSKRRPAQRRR